MFTIYHVVKIARERAVSNGRAFCLKVVQGIQGMPSHTLGGIFGDTAALSHPSSLAHRTRLE